MSAHRARQAMFSLWRWIERVRCSISFIRVPTPYLGIEYTIGNAEEFSAGGKQKGLASPELIDEVLSFLSSFHVISSRTSRLIPTL